MTFKDWLYFEKEDLDKRIRNYPKFRIILVFSAVAFFLVSIFWLWDKTFSSRVRFLDIWLVSFISQFQTPLLTNFFSLITFLGSGYFIAAVFFFLALLLAIKRRKRAAAIVLLSLVVSGFLIPLIKEYFGRSRPFGCLPPADCFSFPSGHATLSFYFYGLLAYLVFRFLPVSLKSFLAIGAAIIALVFLIALSRVFWGVHYPSDILGGFFLGGAWLLLAIFFIDVLY